MVAVRPRSRLVAACFAAIALVLGAPAASAHTAIVIARDSTGRLRVVLPGDSAAIVPPSNFPEAPGWAFGALGFESLFFDYPELDLFAPSGASDIEVVLTHHDPGGLVWSPTAPLEVGQILHFGPPFFDYHPLWQIPDGPGGTEFVLRFIARDRNGIHPDSEEFEVHLIAAFCPADFDQNGFTNGDDFDAYVVAFVDGLIEADFDGNSFVNGDDFDAFVVSFEAGC